MTGKSVHTDAEPSDKHAATREPWLSRLHSCSVMYRCLTATHAPRSRCLAPTIPYADLAYPSPRVAARGAPPSMAQCKTHRQSLSTPVQGSCPSPLPSIPAAEKPGKTPVLPVNTI